MSLPSEAEKAFNLLDQACDTGNAFEIGKAQIKGRCLIAKSQEPPKDKHPTYIQLYRSVNGWQTMLMRWYALTQDEKDEMPRPTDEDGHETFAEPPDGFYDVESTGFGPYGHEKPGYDQARDEGMAWAEDLSVEFKDTPFAPLKPGEPTNLVECLTQLCTQQGQDLLVVEIGKAEGKGDPALGVLLDPTKPACDHEHDSDGAPCSKCGKQGGILEPKESP